MLRAAFSKLSPLAAAVYGLPAAAFASESGSVSVTPVFATLQNSESYGHHMWGGGWFLGPIMMILVLAAIIALVVLIVRWLGSHGTGSAQAAPGRTPLEILKQRFARGEIEQKEFEERRRVLED